MKRKAKNNNKNGDFIWSVKEKEERTVAYYKSKSANIKRDLNEICLKRQRAESEMKHSSDMSCQCIEDGWEWNCLLRDSSYLLPNPGNHQYV